MGFLDGRKILITGLLSSRSIAYGIAHSAREQGAQLGFTYASEELKERTVTLARDFSSEIILKCDVTNDDDIEKVFNTIGPIWGGLDGLVHSIAFAPREALKGSYLDTIDRKSFEIAHDISSFSLGALAKASFPLIKKSGGSILSLSYLGAERVFPNYNVMGLAKASLEANVRYLASTLGPHGVRVNAISAGPIKTLAAAGISQFSNILSSYAKTSPLRKNVTIKEVGNVAAFLLSDLASGVTGEITMVDAGFSTTGIANL